MKEFEAYTLTIMGSRRIYLNFNTLDELKEAVSEHLTFVPVFRQETPSGHIQHIHKRLWVDHLNCSLTHNHPLQWMNPARNIWPHY